MEKYAFCKSFVCACVFAALPCLNAPVWRLHYLHTSLFLCALAGTSFPKCVFLLAKRHIIVLKRHVSTFLEAFFSLQDTQLCENRSSCDEIGVIRKVFFPPITMREMGRLRQNACKLLAAIFGEPHYQHRQKSVIAYVHSLPIFGQKTICARDFFFCPSPS